MNLSLQLMNSRYILSQLENHMSRQQRIKRKQSEIHDYHVLRRSSPLQLNLNCTILWIDKVIPLVDSLVANHVCKGYIHISQSILPSKIHNICYLKVGSTSICCILVQVNLMLCSNCMIKANAVGGILDQKRR